MTNYNERLDNLLTELRSGTINFDDKSKQALTSLIKELVAEARIDPFEFVEPCEPDCDDVRHAYHKGQWDMATRIKTQQEANK